MTENGLTVQAKNIEIKEAKSNVYFDDYYAKKKSGITGSLKDGTAQMGYARSKSTIDAKGFDETVVGSQLVTEKGKLTLNAQGDVNVNAAHLRSGGDMSLSGKNVYLNAVNEQHNSEAHQKQRSTGVGMGFVYEPMLKAENNYRQKEAQGATKTIVGKVLTASEAVSDAMESMGRGLQPYARHSQSESHRYNQQSVAKTTALEAGGNLSIQAREGDIRSQGARISAEGDATFTAKNNIEFGVATHSQSQQANNKSFSLSADGLAKYVAGVALDKERGNTQMTQEVGGQISVGGNSTTFAETGDITLKGTAFVAEGKNRLIAQAGKVNLLTAERRSQSNQARKGHGIGEAVISDTERFFGYNRTRMNQSGENITHQGSQLASLNDSVEVYAGKDYRQTASEVLAKDNVNISAQHITMNNALNHQESSQSESDLKIGQFSRVKSPIIDLIQAVESAVKNDKASDRLKAANAMSIAAQGYSVYDLVSRHMKGNPKDSTYLLRVESGSGVAHSRQSQEAQASISQGSRMNAKDITLTARGDGSLNEKGEKKLGNINLTHTDITARDEAGKRIQDSRITLTGNEINIQAGEAHSKFKGRSQSVGVEVGMAATAGAQTGVGVYARIGASGGKEDGESKTYQASHLEAETVTLNSQGDTNLIGSQAKGKTVNANVGGKLNIESLQDEERFKTKSSGGGLEVEFGFGNNWSISGYGNAASGKTNRKQVNEQAGIFAEEGGYHVNADNVHLKGGAIASQNPQNSQLSTNKLTFEDIQNVSSSQAMSASMSSGYGKKEGEANPQYSPSLPMAERESDRTTTKATLTEGKIILNKDTTPTETTAKALGINTDLTQANNQTATTQDVKAQVAEQQQIATAIGKVRSAAETYAANKREEAEQVLQQKQSELAKANANANAEGNQGRINNLKKEVETATAEVESWGTGGSYKQSMDATINGLGLGLGGFSPEAVAAGVASPYVNTAIKAVADDGTLANLALHGVWGAVEAATQGANAIGGASSAITGEVAAQILSEKLYGQENPENLTKEQKRAISQISQMIAGAVNGATELASGGDTVSTIQNMDVGVAIAKNAVENNAVNKNNAGTVNGFINAFNNSKTRMGETQGDSAEKAMLRLDDIEFKNLKIQPATTGYFNNLPDRYIYTEEAGWLDMAHFMFYAGVAYSQKISFLERKKQAEILNNSTIYPIYDPVVHYSADKITELAVNKAIQKGYWQERLDTVMARHSAYSYEDLPSDKYGAKFGAEYFNPKSNLTFAQQLSEYLNTLRPLDPKLAPNYGSLPDMDRGVHSGIKNKTVKPMYIKGAENVK